jgi:ubiquinone/menaquinone biosynthesis methyltransferase
VTDDSGASQDIYSAKYVRGLFDRMSRSYERMNIVMSFGFSVRWRTQLMKLVPNRESAQTVIDLMTGMGETWDPLISAFPAAELHALDFSERMIAGASTRNAARFGGRLTLLCQDILDSELPDASYDVIVSAYGLKTFDEAQLERLADEVVRILRPGGGFAFIEVTQPPNAVLRALYDFYLSKVVPIVGRVLASDPVEYRMLWRYLRDFRDGARAERAFAHPQLAVIRTSHFLGCATSFSGSRAL